MVRGQGLGWSVEARDDVGLVKVVGLVKCVDHSTGVIRNSLTGEM